MGRKLTVPPEYRQCGTRLTHHKHRMERFAALFPNFKQNGIAIFRHFFPYLNYNRVCKRTLTLHAVILPEMMQVKLCTNDYDSYGNHFLVFCNDRKTNINFIVVVSKLMGPIHDIYIYCIDDLTYIAVLYVVKRMRSLASRRKISCCRVRNALIRRYTYIVAAENSRFFPSSFRGRPTVSVFNSCRQFHRQPSAPPTTFTLRASKSLLSRHLVQRRRSARTYVPNTCRRPCFHQKQRD